jgi:hypothetical protein
VKKSSIRSWSEFWEFWLNGFACVFWGKNPGEVESLMNWRVQDTQLRVFEQDQAQEKLQVLLAAVVALEAV